VTAHIHSAYIQRILRQLRKPLIDTAGFDHVQQRGDILHAALQTALVESPLSLRIYGRGNLKAEPLKVKRALGIGGVGKGFGWGKPTNGTVWIVIHRKYNEPTTRQCLTETVVNLSPAIQSMTVNGYRKVCILWGLSDVFERFLSVRMTTGK